MKNLLIQLYKLTPDDMQQIKEIVADLPVEEGNILQVRSNTLYAMVKRGVVIANNPGVSLDNQGRLMRCSSCGTTENLHTDLGYGGPYRCDSRDCVMF